MEAGLRRGFPGRAVTGSAPGPRVAGIVLAAGASRRMPGRNKLRLAWGGTTVVGAVVRAASAAGLDPVLVVTGHDPDAFLAADRPGGATAIHHAEWARGRASSLGAALARLAPLGDVAAALVLLGDEPEVSPGDVARVVRAWCAEGPDLVRARYRDRPGHPVLLDRRTWEAVRALEGDASTWERLVAAGVRALEVPVDAAAPIDVDDPDDLAAARARLDDAAAEAGP